MKNRTMMFKFMFNYYFLEFLSFSVPMLPNFIPIPVFDYSNMFCFGRNIKTYGLTCEIWTELKNLIIC